MRTTAVVAAAIAMALLAGVEGAGRGEGTERMARRLAALAEAADPLRNSILNAERAALLRQRFRQSETVDIGFGLGRELLKAGDTDAAVDLLEMLIDAIESTNVPDRQTLLTTGEELLALAYLRAGEQGNCLGRHSGASCVFPIGGSGVHQVKEPALAAARLYERLLERAERPSYIWLLNLSHMSAGTYPESVPDRWRIPAERLASTGPFARFVDVAPRAGVDMVGGAGGSIMDDFDNDGDLDLVASDWRLGRQMLYFRNEGKGRFSERTVEAGLEGETGGLNLVHADYDNDGDLDILVLRGGWLFDQGRQPNSLLSNRGDGTFEDVTEEAGLLSFHPTQTAAWADFDGDGWLDLFVGNESGGGEVHPCELFRNQRDGTFLDVAAASGVDNVGFVKGVTWGDYNRDGRPDLYLSRYGQTNVLYRNDGPRGRGWAFTDVTASAGVAEPIASFPAWFWDFDNDGWLDLFVASFTGFTEESLDTLASEYLGRRADAPYSRLYRNNRDGTFKDVTRAVGLDMPLAVMGGNFGDFDGDGYLDLYLGTGEPSLSTLVPNRLFRNDAGRRFVDVTTAAGVGHLQKGHGVSVGDVDGDGDQDLYCVLGGAYSGDVYPNALFENPGNRHHWVTLRLRGDRENRSAIGAQVEISVASPAGARTIVRTIGSGGSFGSSSLQEEIGLGDGTAILRLSVRWPATGRVEQYQNLPIDQVLTLREGREVGGRR